MQQVIRVAEVDEFLSLFIDWHECDIPAIGVRRILNLARSQMRNELDWNAEFLRHRRSQLHGHASVLASRFVFDCVKCGWRRRDCDRDTQFSSWSKFFHHVCLGRHNEAADKRDDETDSEAIGDWH